MPEGFLDELLKGVIAIVTGLLLIAGSLVAVKRKVSFEEKYHILFWLGLLLLVTGFWLWLHRIL